MTNVVRKSEMPRAPHDVHRALSTRKDGRRKFQETEGQKTFIQSNKLHFCARIGGTL